MALKTMRQPLQKHFPGALGGANGKVPRGARDIVKTTQFRPYLVRSNEDFGHALLKRVENSASSERPGVN
jgi:hypothetical protein